MMLSKNNYCFSIIPYINQICCSYFHATQFNFFGHVVAYPDGRFYFLDSSANWPQWGFIEQKIPPIGFTQFTQITDAITFPTMEPGIFNWSDADINCSKQQFNIRNPMIIYKKYDDHYEFYLFDFCHPHAYDLYLNNFDYFEKFIFYYLDKSAKLRKKASTHMMRVDSQYLSDAHKTNGNASMVKLAPSIKPTRFLFNVNGQEQSISSREYDCLSLISKGYTMKSAARELNLSPRTVESHINQMKSKFNMTTQALIHVFWDSKII